MTSTDPLLRPTLQRRGPDGRRPWRLSSLGYVAFFGGVLAGTTVALVDAARLGAPRRTRLGVAAAGAAALAAQVAVLLAVGGRVGEQELLLLRLTGVPAYLVQAWLLRERDRAYVLQGGEHGSLLRVGIGAVICLGLVETVMVAAIMQAVYG